MNGADGVEDFGATSMDFAGGFHGQLTSIWHKLIARASNRRLEVFAENLFAASDADTLGPIVFQRGPAANEETIGDERSDGPIHRKDFARAAVPRANQGSAGDSIRLRGRDLYRRAQGRMRTVSRNSQSGVTAQRMVEAAYESARSGAAVAVKT